MKEAPDPVVDEAMLERLMAQIDANGLELLGPDGVLTELTSRIMIAWLFHLVNQDRSS